MFEVMVMVRVNTTQNLTLTLEPNPQNEIVDLRVITNHAYTPKKQSRGVHRTGTACYRVSCKQLSD